VTPGNSLAAAGNTSSPAAILGKKAQRLNGNAASLQRNALGGLWTARTPNYNLTVSLNEHVVLRNGVLRVFHKTHTIFRNTRPVINGANLAPNAFEAALQASAGATASGRSLQLVTAITA